MGKENNITWFQVNNVVPIIASAIMIAGSFFALSSQVALLSQKIDGIKENTGKIVANAEEDDKRIDNHETRITLLEKLKVSQSKTPQSLAMRAPIVSPVPGPVPSIQPPPSAQQSVQVNQQKAPEQTPASGTPASTPQPTPHASPQPVISIPLPSIHIPLLR